MIYILIKILKKTYLKTGKITILLCIYICIAINNNIHKHNITYITIIDFGIMHLFDAVA